MAGFIWLMPKIIFDGTEIIISQNIDLNSEGQRLLDTFTGNLSEKFTSSGLPAIDYRVIFFHITFGKSRNGAPHTRELTTFEKIIICVCDGEMPCLFVSFKVYKQVTSI